MYRKNIKSALYTSVATGTLSLTLWAANKSPDFALKSIPFGGITTDLTMVWEEMAGDSDAFGIAISNRFPGRMFATLFILLTYALSNSNSIDDDNNPYLMIAFASFLSTCLCSLLLKCVDSEDSNAFRHGNVPRR